MKKKNWYKSKTILASIASLAVVSLSAFLGDTNTATVLAVSVFSALSVYGRASATKGIK